MAPTIEKKWVFFVLLFKKFLSTSHLIEHLAKSLESKEDVRIFSFNGDEIGFERYLKRTIRSLKI